VQVVAPIGREDLLVTVAATLEAAEPWAHRRATVSAWSSPWSASPLGTARRRPWPTTTAPSPSTHRRSPTR